MLEDGDLFDWSGYPLTHPVFRGMNEEEVRELHARNKKVIGKMKDECDGESIDSIVCVLAKGYSIRVTGRDSMKCKGIGKTAVKQQLTHDSYRKCVLDSQRTFVETNTLRSFAHQIYTLRQVKLALVNFDDKRWMCADGINTLPHGHKSIRN